MYTVKFVRMGSYPTLNRKHKGSVIVKDFDTLSDLASYIFNNKSLLCVTKGYGLSVKERQILYQKFESVCSKNINKRFN